MKTLESSPSEVDAKTSTKIDALLDGPPSDDHNLRQIQLAAEKYWVHSEHDRLDGDKRNQIMQEWSDSHYSRDFRAMTEHFDFKTRFQGNVANITLANLEEFVTTNELAEK